MIPSSLYRCLFSVFFSLPIAICLLPSALFSTILGDLAASMQPGTWKELTGTNLTPQLLYSNSSGSQNILEYTDDAQWDPVTEQFLFVGTGHYATWHFVAYTAGTHSWREITGLTWGGVGHAYDHSAINVPARLMYHRPYGSATVRTYNLDGKTFGTLPAVPASVMDYNNCCIGVDYFPELKSLLMVANGHVFQYSETANNWSLKASGLAMSSQYQYFTEYNPVHKVFWFGGGNGSSASHKMDAAGNITAQKNAPVGLGIQQTIITVDPVGGDYLVFTDNGQFYVYDILSDTWTLKSGIIPFFSPVTSTSKIWCTVAAPVSTYGVTMFLKYYYFGPTAWAYVYKHSAGGPTALAPKAAGGCGHGFSVFPNPAAPGTALTVTGRGFKIVNAEILGLDGRLLSSGRLVSPSAAGVYLLRVNSHGKVLTRRLAVIR